MLNLRALPRPDWEDLSDGVFQLRSEVAYEESFFLIEEVIRSLPVAGAPVIALPNRGVLLGADLSDTPAVRTLIAHARQFLQHAAWPLSGTLLTRHADGWTRFEAPAELSFSAQALEKLSLALTCQEQQAALQKVAERIGDPLYVASFSLLAPERGAGRPPLVVFLGEGVLSLLPVTDQIGLTKAVQTPQSEALMRPWALVERICGSRMTKTDEDPPRYRVESFPSAEEWQQLKLASE